MKIRTDFVTNSSSSSFILGFNSKEDGFAKIGALATQASSFKDTWCGDGTETFLRALGELLVDFSKAEPLDNEAIEYRYGDEVKWDAEWEIRKKDGSFFYSKDRETPEYQKLVDDRAEELLNELKREILSKPYCVELEYEDHTDTGCLLEQDLLPDCEFTIKQFSHH